ncbi:hypothetical protein [Acetobacter aceti]|uniref:Uncharacterized protein n=1 Tax=Acetobacter aceti TaxID=435 RepID=A0A6S6PPR5_ACEAC|nr:hypothetical protein [Acetobacter aceti]BCI68615.1 hypothetical protein AAJCM20276_32390 [Acetobacter aceti]
MIPLTITSPAESALWTGERRRTAFLLDTTGEKLSEDGWAQVERLASGPLPVFGAPVKKTAFSPVLADVAGRGTASGETQRHDSSCVCCVGRPVLVDRLLSLIQERARGHCTFFRHIALVVSPDQRQIVAEDLKASPFLANMFSPEAER